jgi:hypothetical protein
MSEVALPPWLLRLLDPVEHWPMSRVIGEGWLFPTFESLHVVGLALLLGSLFMVDLRLLGLAARRFSVRDLSGELIPWTLGGFALCVATGLLMFIVNPVFYASNPAFLAKLGLLALAGANMAVFRKALGRREAFWGAPFAATPAAAKLAGGLSLAVWLCVIAAGRWIAFF